MSSGTSMNAASTREPCRKLFWGLGLGTSKAGRFLRAAGYSTAFSAALIVRVLQDLSRLNLTGAWPCSGLTIILALTGSQNNSKGELDPKPYSTNLKL